MFIGNTNGIKAMKSRLETGKSELSLASTQISEESRNDLKFTKIRKKSFKLKSNKNGEKPESGLRPQLLYQRKSEKQTRILKVIVDKSLRISQLLQNIQLPLKMIHYSKENPNMIILYFLNLSHAKTIYETLINSEIIKELHFLKNVSSFEYCDYALFSNTFNLTEVNILRFLEMIDKVVLLKKISPKRFLVKFDSILIRQNVSRVMKDHFWQFDKRYYKSLICFTHQNYDLIYISMINPLRLKFESIRSRSDSKIKDTRVDITNVPNSRSTLMIKNIPNRIQKQDLIDIINPHFYGNYDFIYLPLDFKVLSFN
jgi:hypothetical protein